MTRIIINDDMSTGISRHADPDERWDCDDTYEEHNIRSIVKGEKDYYDLTVDFDIEPGVQ